MKDSLYIIVNKRGIDRTAKTGTFTLKPTERAFKLNISVPDQAFQGPAIVNINLDIPAERLYIPVPEPEIEVEG